MVRPKAITASIVVMCILSFFGAVGATLGLLSHAGTRAMADNLPTIFLVTAQVIDIVLLVVRRRWTYYLNIFLLCLLAVRFLVFMVFEVRLLLNFMELLIVEAMTAVPTGLLVWLIVLLITRRENIEYLSVSAPGKRAVQLGGPDEI